MTAHPNAGALTSKAQELADIAAMLAQLPAADVRAVRNLLLVKLARKQGLRIVAKGGQR